LPQAHPDEIERSLYEADHVSRAFAEIDAASARGAGFDVVHDHCGFTALAMADRLGTPLLHTLHGPFTPETSAFYSHHAHKAWVAGISDAQLSLGPANLRSVGAIPNPIDVDAWPFRDRGDGYLLWIGRMTPEKGPDRAIRVAHAACKPLILAGVVQPQQQAFFDENVAPHIDDDLIRFVGEVGGERKKALFAGADALLMPIRWPEPFGMVMIEALVCGTPVIAFPEGAARELVLHGQTGFLVDDEAAMVDAIDRLAEIDSQTCRNWVTRRCGLDVVTAAYERVYHSMTPARSLQPALATP
jgi:glycosyltransferase involved in cell wall biosynthesis